MNLEYFLGTFIIIENAKLVFLRETLAIPINIFFFI